MDPRIWIRIHPKISWIRNTAIKGRSPTRSLLIADPDSGFFADEIQDLSAQRKIFSGECELNFIKICSDGLLVLKKDVFFNFGKWAHVYD